MIVLDTNVISELLRPAPAPQVEAWLAAQNAATVYFTTVSEAELRHGVAILPAGRLRSALGEAIETILEEDFRDRILPFDRAASISGWRRANSGLPNSRPAGWSRNCCRSSDRFRRMDRRGLRSDAEGRP